MKNITIYSLTTLTLMIWMSGCKKDFLNGKPDKSLLVPTTIADFKALLDNYSVMNFAPFLTAVSSDDIYTTAAGYQNTLLQVKNSYLWQKDIFQGETFISDWSSPYECVYYSNIVLDGLKNITDDNKIDEINKLKGQALFYRAMAFYLLSQEFAAPFESNTANTIPGIPLRLESNVLIKSVRGTLKKTYDQILADLNLAISILPDKTDYKTQPTKNAGYALLTKIHLVMGNYEEANLYSTKCLTINKKLIDYNTLQLTTPRPFPFSFKDQNDEVIYASSINIGFLNSSNLTSVDSVLYNSYDNHDLRKLAFFTDKGNGIRIFKGNYTGGGVVFAGLATDEIYLIKSECLARLGNVDQAMEVLNQLMSKRWNNKVEFPELTAQNSLEALNIILNERRKELVYRNTRWTDLRRLNLDTRLAKRIFRIIDGTTYSLEPNDKRYTFPIPEAEIKISGIEQNQR